MNLWLRGWKFGGGSLLKGRFSLVGDNQIFDYWQNPPTSPSGENPAVGTGHNY